MLPHGNTGSTGCGWARHGLPAVGVERRAFRRSSLSAWQTEPPRGDGVAEPEPALNVTFLSSGSWAHHFDGLGLDVTKFMTDGTALRRASLDISSSPRASVSWHRQSRVELALFSSTRTRGPLSRKTPRAVAVQDPRTERRLVAPHHSRLACWKPRFRQQIGQRTPDARSPKTGRFHSASGQQPWRIALASHGTRPRGLG